MKTERLYAITVYLLNHGRTSASELAKHFEVSTRTIQRDMDSLCLAGIPVVAVNGAVGGYEISDRFTMEKGFATAEDYTHILTALRGLVSATDDQEARHTLEKITHASDSGDNGIILDFSVLREGDQLTLQRLQTAVLEKHTVEFLYTNNNGETRVHKVEPVAVIYRWYAWYLLAYSGVKKDYRTYKLVRMRDLTITSKPFEKEHESAEVILRESDKTDSRQYTEIQIRCRETARARVREYLKGTVIREYSGGDVLMKVTVVDNEQFWVGTLLSLGDAVEVVSPKRIRDRLRDCAEKIVNLYGNV